MQVQKYNNNKKWWLKSFSSSLQYIKHIIAPNFNCVGQEQPTRSSCTFSFSGKSNMGGYNK